MKNNKIQKIIFLSNYFNHHQKPFCDEICKQISTSFYFIETSIITQERLSLGWGVDNLPSYVISNSMFLKNKEYYMKLINEADVLIFGSAPEKYITRRKKENKLIFRYSERPLKKGLEPLKYIPRFVKWHYLNYSKRIYLLCASAYTYSDYSKFNLFKDKAYKWGYFTELKKYESCDLLLKQKEKNSIIWVGRFIECKQPIIALEIAKRLKASGFCFTLKMIGDGELNGELRKKVIDFELQEVVEFLGAMKPEEVRKYMEKSKIHLFTSNQEEGWGAVLNESMNSFCISVVNPNIGSVPFLIKDKVNGFIYNSLDDAVEIISNIFKSIYNNDEIATSAYLTIFNEWNPENAATKLLKVAESLINDERFVFENGVCSSAKILED